MIKIGDDKVAYDGTDHDLGWEAVYGFQTIFRMVDNETKLRMLLSLSEVFKIEEEKHNDIL